MTSLAMPRAGIARPSRTTAGSSGARRSGTWSQPETWTVALLLATGVVVVARHPLAHLLGTEVETTSTTPAVVAPPAPVPTTGSTAAAAAAGLKPLPTHAPRDPFHALARAGGAVLAPGAVSAPTATHHDAEQPRAAHHRAPAASPSNHCTGTSHRVVAGESLWSIAASTVGGNDGKVAVSWRRIYAANRATIGSNPELLAVGTHLCVPNAL